MPELKESLIRYIKEEKRRGFSREQIRAALFRAGYGSPVVEDHLQYAYGQWMWKGWKRWAYLIVSASVFVALFVMGVFLYFGSQGSAEESAGDLYNLGEEAMDEGRYGDAVSHYSKITEMQPESGKVHYYLGRAYFNLGEYEKAIAAFNASQDKGYNPEFNYEMIGWSYYLMEEYDTALGHFEKAIEANATYYNTYCGLGSFYYQKGIYNASLKAFKNCLRDKNNLLAHYGLARLYYEEKRYDEALSEIDEALKSISSVWYQDALEFRVKIIEAKENY